MIAGIDFPSRFNRDNFTSRRTTGHNMYDPECLMSGAEDRAGYTYTNSARDWDNEAHYLRAVLQEITPEEILFEAPRVFLSYNQQYLLLSNSYQEVA